MLSKAIFLLEILLSGYLLFNIRKILHSNAFLGYITLFLIFFRGLFYRGSNSILIEIVFDIFYFLFLLWMVFKFKTSG